MRGPNFAGLSYEKTSAWPPGSRRVCSRHRAHPARLLRRSFSLLGVSDQLTSLGDEELGFARIYRLPVEHRTFENGEHGARNLVPFVGNVLDLLVESRVGHIIRLCRLGRDTCQCGAAQQAARR